MSSHWPLKHQIRQQLHPQLKAIWDAHPLLKQKRDEVGSLLNTEKLAADRRIPPWRFVPLVTEELQVACEIEFLLLRRDHPGSSIWSGDPDNRVKTIIDALEVPDINSGYAADIPLDASFNPLYCLVANDRLVTSVSIKTGQLLAPPPVDEQSWADVNMKVVIKPINVTMLNLGL